MYVHMPHGNKLFHVKQYSNDVAKNICVIFYLCDKEYSIKNIFLGSLAHAHLFICSHSHSS
jgi:hypothetical protein